jgi:2-polyprenyl-6-methoxyphenol hydroxylase-like FAD-dependent oxidoreductase
MSDTSKAPSIPLPGKGKRILISGGSIAGPAIAWWLHKYGFETELVERWHELRPGGQNIDVRGVGVSPL